MRKAEADQAAKSPMQEYLSAIQFDSVAWLFLLGEKRGSHGGSAPRDMFGALTTTFLFGGVLHRHSVRNAKVWKTGEDGISQKLEMSDVHVEFG